jgi:protein-arginine kinase activator protein McsA
MTEQEIIAKLDELTTQLKQAIAERKYELAASLRDEIRKYKEKLEDLLNKDQHQTNSSGNQE